MTFEFPMHSTSDSLFKNCVQGQRFSTKTTIEAGMLLFVFYINILKMFCQLYIPKNVLSTLHTETLTFLFKNIYKNTEKDTNG